MDGYKATRDEKSRNFNREVFAYTYQTLLPSLLEKYGFQMIGHRSLEADDVIAILTNMLLDVENMPKTNICIITNDNDYIQLLNHPALKSNANAQLVIKNMQDKHLEERTVCPPDVYLEVKKILGDKSDNIPPAL
jgi:5'-3' exonuclease